MEQIRRRLIAEQLKLAFKAYCQDTSDWPAVQETSGIGRATFFTLLGQ